MSQADPITQSCFDTLLAATAGDDYDRFVSVGDDAFRRGIVAETFHTICQSLTPRSQRGCVPTYLGQLRQNDAEVSLWKLAFSDGGDDLLVRMSISQGRVDGFLITPPFY